MSSVAQALKTETMAVHEETESILLPHLTQLRSRDHYARLLQHLHGFYEPMEDRIHQQLPVQDLPDLPQRRSSRHIMADLTHMGYARKQDCLQLPRIQTTAQAWGALYVLEGSTLGGRVITRMLQKQTHLDLHENSLQFFSGYGENTGSMWMNFLHHLEKQPLQPSLIQAAIETFRHFTVWIKQFEA